jgi:hypothetical protein
MFTVKFYSGLPPNEFPATARASTVDGALGFIKAFCELPCGLIVGPWVECCGRYILDVYSWEDCWFDDPHILATVMAPQGDMPADVPGYA